MSDEIDADDLNTAMRLIYRCSKRPDASPEFVEHMVHYTERVLLNLRSLTSPGGGCDACRVCGCHLKTSPRYIRASEVIGFGDALEFRRVEDQMCLSCAPQDVVVCWKKRRKDTSS